MWKLFFKEVPWCAKYTVSHWANGVPFVAIMDIFPAWIRYVDGTPTSEVTPVTIRDICPPHHGHTSQYHGHEWMTHHCSHPFRSMSIDRPIPEIKLFQALILKFQLQDQGHGCGQRARSYNRPSIILTHFVFHFTLIRPTIPEIELFRNLTLKHPRSRSWVRSKVKVRYCTQYPTNALPLRFTSIGPTIPEMWPK